MIDVGIISLDTSHAEKFSETIDRRPDMTVGAVWDDEDVRTETYVTEFREVYDTPRYDTLRGLVDHVDAAMVLTVDWDRHVPIAT